MLYCHDIMAICACEDEYQRPYVQCRNILLLNAICHKEDTLFIIENWFAKLIFVSLL